MFLPWLNTPEFAFETLMSSLNEFISEPHMPWVAYTPTISSQSGTLTSASATGRYAQFGRTVFVAINAVITTNGTGAGSINVSLPIASMPDCTFGNTAPVIFVGRNLTVGGTLDGVLTSTTNLRVRKYDNSYPGADATELCISGFYDVP